MTSSQLMAHPFGELAIPSIEVGFDERASDFMWERRLTPGDDGYGRWNDFLSEPSASPYNISPAGTPINQSPERSFPSAKTSPKASPKHSPKLSPPVASSSLESEEERRKSRKREQNRESQRNFRRRQENRVKFLESKTLELEASSRQLRAENERLKTELVHAHQRNDELFAMMSMPTTPVSVPLDMANDRRRGQQQAQQQHQRYSPQTMALPLSFDLNEEQFYVPPAVMQNSPTNGW